MPSTNQVTHRLSVITLFSITGWIYANLASRLGDISVLHNLPEEAISWGTISIGVGMFSLRPFTAWFIKKAKVSYLILGSGLVVTLSFLSLVLFESPSSFFVSLALLGISIGVFDLIANVLGAQLECTYKKAYFSSLHGGFSLAMIFGAGVSAWFIARDFSIVWQFVSTAAIAICVLLTSILYLPPLKQKLENTEKKQPLITIPVRSTWVVGFIALCSIVCESSITGWMSKYMTEFANSESYISVWPIVAFSFSMTIGRFMGDSFRAIVGDRDFLRDGAILASIGLLLCLIYPNPTVIIIGASIAGLGLSAIIPITYSIVARTEGLSMISSVSMLSIISSSGIFLGPAIIGTLSSFFDMRIGYSFTLVALGLIIYLSRQIEDKQLNRVNFLATNDRLVLVDLEPTELEDELASASSE